MRGQPLRHPPRPSASHRSTRLLSGQLPGAVRTLCGRTGVGQHSRAARRSPARRHRHPRAGLVDGASFDSATGTAVFWATPKGGRSWMLLPGGYERASLYAAPAPAFQVRRLAEEVDTVAVGPSLVLANVHFSPQNQTGDLVLYDLRSGHERTLASPVSSFWVAPACPNPASLSPNAKWKPGWGMVGGTSSTEIAMPSGCPADSPLLVTFTVRGPIASDKDGLWAITVQP